MFKTFRLLNTPTAMFPLETHKNSYISVKDTPLVVPQIVQPPAIVPPAFTPPSIMKENVIKDDTLLSRIRSYLLTDAEEPILGPSTSASTSDSQLLALNALKDSTEKVQLCYRYFPDHTSWINGTFFMTKPMMKRLKQLFKEIDFFSSSIPYYVPEVFQHSNLGQGMRSLVNENYDKIVVEALTFYKGEYGRVVILASLGVCCTVWSLYVPGVAGLTPPLDNFPRFESYQQFFNPETTKDLFDKVTFIQRTDISEDVIKTFENEIPFKDMNIPATGDKKIAIGLALMIVVFMALGVAPVKEQIRI
uniref:hypothetical protein n=1 Tax=Bidens tripartita TaxID=51276 RepID=UPI001FF25DC5|nr:hypothetical protein LK193_mgp44 [Bidens tripartita]YP_010352670.1 hypothetical protein LK193_mgp14 [Bidens tripartita]UIR98995.1 hypothetical protein [Bidens tripartita]UIR99025.1 hypothetical protein [Bidens tripartita]